MYFAMSVSQRRYEGVYHSQSCYLRNLYCIKCMILFIYVFYHIDTNTLLFIICSQFFLELIINIFVVFHSLTFGELYLIQSRSLPYSSYPF